MAFGTEALSCQAASDVADRKSATSSASRDSRNRMSSPSERSIAAHSRMKSSQSRRSGDGCVRLELSCSMMVFCGEELVRGFDKFAVVLEYAPVAGVVVEH